MNTYQGQDERPHRHLGRPDLNDYDSKHEHSDCATHLVRDGLKMLMLMLTEDNGIPPVGNLWVLGHQTGVNISLLVYRAASLSPDLLAVVDEGVGESGGDRRKRETVRDGEGGRQEERGVCLVFSFVKVGILDQDLLDLVPAGCVVERSARIEGHVLGIPDVFIVEYRRENP